MAKIKFDFQKDYGKLNYVVQRADYATLYAILYNYFFERAIEVFKWEGLPEEIKPEYIEYALFNFGQCVFGKRKGANVTGLSEEYLKDIGYIALPSNGAYYFNYYGQPVKWRAQGLGYNQEYSVLDSVLMRNTYTRMPSVIMIGEYVNRMVDCLLACDVNINSNKTPFAIYGDKSTISTIQSFVNSKKRNDFACVIDKDAIAGKKLERIDLDVEYKADKFWDMFNNYKSLIFEMLGINTLAVEKKERLITDEANANNEAIDFNIGAMLKARQDACEEINKMFGLNVSVTLRYTQEVTDYAENNNTDNE